MKQLTIYVLLLIGAVHYLSAQVTISPEGIRTNATSAAANDVFQFDEGLFRAQLDLTPTGVFNFNIDKPNTVLQEVLTINASFFTGIGTTTPTSLLHVNDGGVNVNFSSNTLLGISTNSSRFLSLVNFGELGDEGRLGINFGDALNLNAAILYFSNEDRGLTFNTIQDSIPLYLDTLGNLAIGLKSIPPQAALTIGDSTGISLYDGMGTLEHPGRIRMTDRITGGKNRDDLLLASDESIFIQMDSNDDGISSMEIDTDVKDTEGFLIYKDGNTALAEKIFSIRQGGQVGIGGVAPAVKLYVNKGNNNNTTFADSTAIGIRADDNTFLPFIHSDDGIGEIGILFGDSNNNTNGQIVHNDLGLQFRTAGLDRVTIAENTGFLGIGTTDPQAAISIDAPTGIALGDGNEHFAADVKMVDEITEGGNTADDLLFSADERVLIKMDNGGNGISGVPDNGTSEGFGIYNNTNTRLFSIRQKGEVGIGTFPDLPLHVKDGESTASFLPNTVMGIETNDTAFLAITTGDLETKEVGLLFGDETDNTRAEVVYNSKGMQLKTDKTFTISPTGFVGIRTESPAGALTVNDPKGIYLNDDDDPFDARFRMVDGIIENLVTDRKDLLIEADGAVFMNVDANGDGISGPDNGLVVYNNENELFIVKEDGKVGINVDPFGSGILLSVNGTAAKIAGGPWSTLSDQRLKKNIRPYRDGLKQLLQIEPIHYRYNGKGGIKTKAEFVGIIAQDMQQIAPYIVRNCPLKEGEKTVDYLSYDDSALTYMLINGVQEQQQMIEAPDEQLDKFRDDLTQLERELEALAARIQILQQEHADKD